MEIKDTYTKAERQIYCGTKKGGRRNIGFLIKYYN